MFQNAPYQAIIAAEGQSGSSPGPPPTEPDPVQPAVRLATAAAHLTDRQRCEADVESRLASTEMPQREMREIRTLLQSVLPNVAVASAGPVASSSRAAAVATSRQGSHRLHRLRLHQQAVRGSTSWVRAHGNGSCPPMADGGGRDRCSRQFHGIATARAVFSSLALFKQIFEK